MSFTYQSSKSRSPEYQTVDSTTTTTTRPTSLLLDSVTQRRGKAGLEKPSFFGGIKVLRFLKVFMFLYVLVFSDITY